MDKIKVMTIFGTRPEAIKMAPLIKAVDKCDRTENIVCVTGQHREMLMQVLDIFNITPDVNLDIMKDKQTLSSITASVITGLDKIIDEKNPDIVLVHGDTSTTLAGAIAAFYHKKVIGHVEAGLRTYDKYSPYPEEMNRVLTSDLADLHFAPTENNEKNLKIENIKNDIYITGNTVIDALSTTVKKDYIFHNKILGSINFNNKRTILMTAHRRENLGQPLENICRAVSSIVSNNEDVQVIYPVHLNPAVRETAKKHLGGKDRIYLIDPIDVEDMHNLMARSYLVMTDSGGLQEEAPSLGKPVVVLRAETERPEAVEAGTVIVAGIQKDNIFNITNELLNNKEKYDKMARAVNPYGDGNASKYIVEAIIKYFDK